MESVLHLIFSTLGNVVQVLKDHEITAYGLTFSLFNLLLGLSLVAVFMSLVLPFLSGSPRDGLSSKSNKDGGRKKNEKGVKR